MADLVLLTFDVEEFDLPLEFGGRIREKEQLDISARGLEAVLDLLDELDVRATMLTTALFAQRQPALAARMSRRHEIASHGFRHDRLEEADLALSRKVLSELTGQQVRGFRRARFAPTDSHALLQAGYSYSSSENPIWLPGRYNNLAGPRTAYEVDGLLEIPVSTSPRLRMPLFWLAFKHLPLPLIRSASRRTLAADGYLNLVFHPWEFTDIDLPAVPWYVRRRCGAPMLTRLRRYLEWLGERAQFGTCGEFEQRYRESRG